MQSIFHKTLTNTIKKLFKKVATKWTFILLCVYRSWTPLITTQRRTWKWKPRTTKMCVPLWLFLITTRPASVPVWWGSMRGRKSGQSTPSTGRWNIMDTATPPSLEFFCSQKYNLPTAQMAKTVGSEEKFTQNIFILLRTCDNWIFPVKHDTFTLWWRIINCPFFVTQCIKKSTIGTQKTFLSQVKFVLFLLA